MNRDAMMERIADASEEPWDILVIGGGATGLGAALDATTRGYRTLLLEGCDFAKGTSSRSTKIIHGGVRYLRQGNIRLVRDSLRERGMLMQNCPELVTERGFIVPHFRWWDRFFYGLGLKVYDWLAGDLGLSPSKRLSREKMQETLPTLTTRKLRGGTLYADGQFDDARLAIALARAAAEHGATLANYARVESLVTEHGKVSGVVARDLETGEEHSIRSRAVINATGVFSDGIRHMDDPDCGTLIAPSQGIHVVLDGAFLPSEHALMIPKTDDGRLLFAIPWHGKIVAGTTDTPLDAATEEPRPLDDEIDYMLDHLRRYLDPAPGREDIKSAWAGLRPLVRPSGRPGSGPTSKVSRDHTIEISKSGLVTIAGGKWTTFRHMGEDVIDRAARAAGLSPRACKTKSLRLAGSRTPDGDPDDPLHPGLELSEAQVVEAARNEMARTVEDVLTRRSRSLFLDARACLEAAPRVAEILASELGHTEDWRESQIDTFTQLAQGYMP